MTISRGLPNVAYVFFVCKRSASAVLFSTIFWGFTCLDKCLSSEGKSGRMFFALRLRLEIKTSRCVWKCGVRFTFELKDSSMYYSCICVYIYIWKNITYIYMLHMITYVVLSMIWIRSLKTVPSVDWEEPQFAGNPEFRCVHCILVIMSSHLITWNPDRKDTV